MKQDAHIIKYYWEKLDEKDNYVKFDRLFITDKSPTSFLSKDK